MAERQMSWDKYEAAILLEGLLASMKRELTRSDAIKAVSRDLRAMALHRGMEVDEVYRNTKSLVTQIESFCRERDIAFFTAKATMSASDSWDFFGPPARRLRWCCTVHKTAPVINKLCEIHNINRIHSMMITGVRGDESASRAEYDELSLGKKMPGQHSFHPLLEWSSAEVFLYIYSQELPMNTAYKYGFNRVGCIMCPNSSEKHEYIKKQCFPETVDFFCNKIIENSQKDLSGDNAARFLESGGWKTRLSGRELKFSQEELFEFDEEKGLLKFTAKNLRPEWKIWYKTLGDIHECSENEYHLEYDGVVRKCVLHTNGDKTIFEIETSGRTKNSIEFVYYFKSILAKTQYCIQCMTCVAECPSRNIQMKDGELTILDTCVRCRACLKILSGCLYYNSVKGSYDDRLTIYSPGGMADGTRIQERDISNISSTRRNPVLADIFGRLGYMERQGSGFKKITESYHAAHNYRKELEPEFYSDVTSFQVTLYNLNYGTTTNSANVTIEDESVAITTDYVAIEAAIDGLNASQTTIKKAKEVYKNMGTDGIFGRSDISSITGDSVTAAGNLISKLKAASLIAPVKGHGKGKYRFIEPHN